MSEVLYIHQTIINCVFQDFVIMKCQMLLQVILLLLDFIAFFGYFQAQVTEGSLV